VKLPSSWKVGSDTKKPVLLVLFLQCNCVLWGEIYVAGTNVRPDDIVNRCDTSNANGLSFLPEDVISWEWYAVGKLVEILGYCLCLMFCWTSLKSTG
jgi:hypothetical protein